MDKNKKVTPFQAITNLPLLSFAAYYYFHLMDEDIWVEMFKEFPIESMCRLRTVCKWWNSIISSASFIDLHHSFTRSATPCNLKSYLHVAGMRLLYKNNPNYTDLNHKWHTLCRPLDDVIQHSRQPLPDRDYGLKKVTFVGVIHGVICISFSWCTSWKSPFPSYNSTFLWNPMIHKYISLPRVRSTGDYALGFGYDTSRKDFKVVMVFIKSKRYQVYSLRQGCWRIGAAKIGVLNQGPVRYRVVMNRSCFVKGTINWSMWTAEPKGVIDYGKKREHVVVFDCVSEEFRRIDLHEELFRFPISPSNVELFEYAGMLAALVKRCWYPLELWVLMEEEQGSTWKKLYMIPAGDAHITIFDPSYENLAPYGPMNKWNMYNGITSTSTYSRFYEILSVHVYDQTMLLMDHPNAQSYTNHEIVTILTTEEDH